MIPTELLDSLKPGDKVEMSRQDGRGSTMTATVARGPEGELFAGPVLLRWTDGEALSAAVPFQLTVVERAPDPMYVNHHRGTCVMGDVVRDADDITSRDTWVCMDIDSLPWKSANLVNSEWYGRGQLPSKLQLLVDGETGQVVR